MISLISKLKLYNSFWNSDKIFLYKKINFFKKYFSENDFVFKFFSKNLFSLNNFSIKKSSLKKFQDWNFKKIKFNFPIIYGIYNF